MKGFIQSANWALDGILYTLKTQRNMRIHFVTAVLVIVAALLTYTTRFEIIALCLTITLVIMAEMFNTAIEAVVDMYTKKYHPLARVAKNVAAGAVLMTALNALVVGYVIFVRKLYLGYQSLNYMIYLPSHVIFACLFVVAVAVIFLKSRTMKKKRGTFVHGGMPSGHAALAFSLFTAMALVSMDPIIVTCSAVLALLVAESRLEADVHSMAELAAGALIGILVTVILFQVISMLGGDVIGT